MLRRRRFRQTVPLESWSGACEGPDREVAARLDCEELRRHLCNLTDDQRQVIYLRFMADLSVQEVALRLGRSEGAQDMVCALQGARSTISRLHSWYHKSYHMVDER